MIRKRPHLTPGVLTPRLPRFRCFRERSAVRFGPAEIEALTLSTVPHLAVDTGRAGDPRFVFSWPADEPSGGDDDGVIDPRDTRTVLGLCLSAAHSAAVEGTGHLGVFRPGKVDQ